MKRLGISLTTVAKLGKWIASILLGLTVLICIYLAPYFLLSPGPPTPRDEISTLNDLDQYFASMVAVEFPPALDITVIKDSSVVFSRAYGIANGITGEAATPEHVYHYWSITKTFTAVAIFQLVDRGKISLTESITTYLPKFIPLDQHGKPVEITVENLLNHSSGLPDFTSKLVHWVHDIDTPRFGDTRMVNERLMEYRTVSQVPGAQSNYKNINYVLLGAAIESVTGSTYEDYIRKEILTPLQMNGTDFVYRTDMLDKMVIGTLAHYSFYTPLFTFVGPEGGLDKFTLGQKNDRHWLKPIYTDYVASTALIGTGADLGRFGQMLLNGGELGGVRVLSRKSTDKVLHKGHLTNGDNDVTLGYGTMRRISNGVVLIGHGGGGPGYALQYILVPEKKLVIVVLTNGTLVDANKLSSMIADVF